MQHLLRQVSGRLNLKIISRPDPPLDTNFSAVYHIKMLMATGVPVSNLLFCFISISEGVRRESGGRVQLFRLHQRDLGTEAWHCMWYRMACLQNREGKRLMCEVFFQVIYSLHLKRSYQSECQYFCSAALHSKFVLQWGKLWALFYVWKKLWVNMVL